MKAVIIFCFLLAAQVGFAQQQHREPKSLNNVVQPKDGKVSIQKHSEAKKELVDLNKVVPPSPNSKRKDKPSPVHQLRPLNSQSNNKQETTIKKQ